MGVLGVRSCGPQTTGGVVLLVHYILADEQVAAFADCLPAIRDSMCVGGDRVVIKCESGNFRPHTPRRHGSARLFVGTEYISLTLPDMDYLVRVFHIIQQQMIHYISAMPDVLSYVTSSLASTTFVEPPLNASTFINLFVCTRSL